MVGYTNLLVYPPRKTIWRFFKLKTHTTNYPNAGHFKGTFLKVSRKGSYKINFSLKILRSTYGFLVINIYMNFFEDLCIWILKFCKKIDLILFHFYKHWKYFHISKGTKSVLSKIHSTRRFTAALITITKIWNQTMCSLREEWAKKRKDKYTMSY